MRLAIHAGHTKQSGSSAGASGYVHESIVDRQITKKVISILRSRGHTVYDCTSEGNGASDNLYRIVNKSNAHSVDLVVSIHLNCYNGKGHGTEVEVYDTSSKATKYAKKIAKNISALGFTNRGVKEMPYLYVLRHTNSPALLIESFFCDNKSDYNTFKEVGVTKIATAIANGIVTTSKKKKKSPKKYKYKALYNMNVRKSKHGAVVGMVSKGKRITGSITGEWLKIGTGKYVRIKNGNKTYLRRMK